MPSVHIHPPLPIICSGTCVLRTPWDQPKVSRLSRCPDFFQVSLHDSVSFGTTAKCVDYAGVHISSVLHD